MLFRKRTKNRAGVLSSSRGRATAAAPGYYRIDYDMMLKGATIGQGKRAIRQFGVTVHGATRLVTSGDVVDRETYEALLAAGAVRAEKPDRPGEPTP